MHFRGCAIVVHGGVEIRVVRKRQASLDVGHYMIDATSQIGPGLVQVCRLSRHVGEPRLDCQSVFLRHGGGCGRKSGG